MSVPPVDTFKERLGQLIEAWKANAHGEWENFTALVVVTGKRPEDELRYLKSVALHLWLFGVEIADIVVAFSTTQMRIVCNKGKKADYLGHLVAPAKAVGVNLELLIVDRGTSSEPQCKALLDFAAATGSPAAVAGLPKLKQAGNIHDVFEAALTASGIALADAALALGLLLARHTSPVLEQNIKKSGFLTSNVMSAAIKLVEKFVDSNKPVRHSKLSDDIVEIITNPQKKANIKLKAENCEVAYLPVVQSGGAFDLRVGAATDDKQLHDGVVLLHIGARYNMECTNACRTLFFNPDEQMESAYAALLAAQQAAIAALKPGAPLSAAYAAAAAALKAKGHADLAAKLGKNIGFAMGLELREAKLVLSASNEAVVQAGMVFNVAVGAAGLENAAAKKTKDRTYAIQLADTVLVSADKPAEVLTRFAKTGWQDVSYDIASSEAEDDEYEASPLKSRDNLQDPNLGRGRRGAQRATEAAEHMAQIAERNKKQAELSARKNQETFARLTAQANQDNGQEATGRSVTDCACYSGVGHVPPQRDLLIQVDRGHEALLVPIMGVHVPLHITTVKGINYSQDGEHAYIRIQLNFMPSYEARAAHPAAAFVKELSFRSCNPKHAQRCVQEAQTLRRNVLAKDKEDAERATLVKQEKLVRFVSKQPFRLPDVWVFPNIGGGRKQSGMLEAHQNGFRYVMPKGDYIDIMFSNVRHAFFQPAQKEMITLLHFHLKNPIMVGKKKTLDVQIYTEVIGDTAATLDGRGRSAYDPDEIEEEQRERERRARINKEFQRFTKRIQEHWDKELPRLKLEWDAPYRELAFQGVAGRNTVHLMPTISCLVQLVEPPYTVITISDIEIVNLERVGFNLKNFDMVVVFKDFTRDVVSIGSIPSQSLDDIKNWLNSADIKFFESKMNLQWKQILKQIAADPQAFLDEGGWAGFLDLDRSDSEGEEEEVSEEFRPSSDSEEVSDDAEGSEDESVVDSEDASEDYSGGDSEEESGKDWDELEDEARRADKMKDELNEDDERRQQKRKAPPPTGRGAPPAKKRR